MPGDLLALPSARELAGAALRASDRADRFVHAVSGRSVATGALRPMVAPRASSRISRFRAGGLRPMATLILGTLGQAAGQAVFGSTAFSLFGASISGARSAAWSAGSSARRSTTSSSRARSRARARASPRSRSAGAEEGAAIPRVYRARAHRRPGHLGLALPRNENDAHAEGRRQGPGRRRRLDQRHRDGLRLFRQLRRRAVRRADRRHRPHLGRRAGARCERHHLPRSSGNGGSSARQRHRGDRRRGRGAGLSRPRLRRVRGFGARTIRQPHPAVAVRGVSPDRGGWADARKFGARRRRRPGHRRVRLRDEPRVPRSRRRAGARPRT